MNKENLMSTSLKSSVLTIALISGVTLAARAHVDPNTQLPAADAPQQKEGFATGTIVQDANGSGRMIADLMTYDGTRRLVLVADLKADLGGPEAASSKYGTLMGYLHTADTPDPWKTTSDLVVLGTWNRSFDTGSFHILVIERDGLNEHVMLVGEISGSFGADHQLVSDPSSATDRVQADADSAAAGGTNGIVGPKSGSLFLVAPVLARWILY
jgi:hypothetical protein